MVSRILKYDPVCVLDEKLTRAANGEKDADGNIFSQLCILHLFSYFCSIQQQLFDTAPLAR